MADRRHLAALLDVTNTPQVEAALAAYRAGNPDAGFQPMTRR